MTASLQSAAFRHNRSSQNISMQGGDHSVHPRYGAPKESNNWVRISLETNNIRRRKESHQTENWHSVFLIHRPKWLHERTKATSTLITSYKKCQYRSVKKQNKIRRLQPLPVAHLCLRCQQNWNAPYMDCYVLSPLLSKNGNYQTNKNTQVNGDN